MTNSQELLDGFYTYKCHWCGGPVFRINQTPKAIHEVCLKERNNLLSRERYRNQTGFYTRKNIQIRGKGLVEEEPDYLSKVK
jgi:hypothetical protein